MFDYPIAQSVANYRPPTTGLRASASAAKSLFRVDSREYCRLLMSLLDVRPCSYNLVARASCFSSCLAEILKI